MDTFECACLMDCKTMVDRKLMDITLLIVVSVLGCLVIILGLIYAYIYHFKIKQKRSTRDYEAKYQDTSNQSGQEGQKRFIPFLFMSYAAKGRQT